MKLNTLQFRNRAWQYYNRSQADKSVFKEIFELREYKEIEPIIKSARNPIIDAGAQAGFFILYCRALNPKVEIYALEPDEANLQILEQHISLNKITNVNFDNSALVGESGLRDFYISKDTHNHSLYKDYLPAIAKRVKVRGVSLPDFLQENDLKQISLLKMDIEGSEYEVLNSLQSADWIKIPAIFLEYHDWIQYHHTQLEKILQQNGFRTKIRVSKYDKNLGYIWAEKK